MKNLWLKIAASPLIKSILSAVFTGMIVVLLLTQISPADVWHLLTEAALPWIALGVLLYFVNNIGRAIRLRILLPNQNTQFYKVLLIVNAYTMFNYILPVWMGEVSLLYFLKKYEDVSLDKGGAALVVGRIMDYLAVAVLFIIGAWLLRGQLLAANATLTTTILEAALVIILAAIIVLVALVWGGQQAVKLTEGLMQRLGLRAFAPVKFTLKALDKIVAAFAAIHSFRRYLLAFGWSFCLWVTIFTRFYAFMRGIGIKATLLETVVGSTFAVISKSIPFLTFGGIGTHEAGWTIGFVLVGFDKTTAISSGFAVNILTLLTTILIGAASLAMLRFINKRRQNPAGGNVNKTAIPSLSSE